MQAEEKIRELAHRLWEREGKPEGKAMEHWARASEMLEPGPPGEVAIAGAAGTRATGTHAASFSKKGVAGTGTRVKSRKKP